MTCKHYVLTFPVKGVKFRVPKFEIRKSKSCLHFKSQPTKVHCRDRQQAPVLKEGLQHAHRFHIVVMIVVVTMASMHQLFIHLRKDEHQQQIVSMRRGISSLHSHPDAWCQSTAGEGIRRASDFAGHGTSDTERNDKAVDGDTSIPTSFTSNPSPLGSWTC